MCRAIIFNLFIFSVLGLLQNKMLWLSPQLCHNHKTLHSFFGGPWTPIGPVLRLARPPSKKHGVRNGRPGHWHCCDCLKRRCSDSGQEGKVTWRRKNILDSEVSLKPQANRGYKWCPCDALKCSKDKRTE